MNSHRFPHTVALEIWGDWSERDTGTTGDLRVLEAIKEALGVGYRTGLADGIRQRRTDETAQPLDLRVKDELVKVEPVGDEP